MTSYPIIIGTRPEASRSPKGERRPPLPEARDHARQPIPRRIPNEFYPTPPEAVRALLSVEQFDGSIWEPACGEGAISKVLSAAGHQVVSTDRFAYGFGETGVDFLAEQTPRARHIVTNPPYGARPCRRLHAESLGVDAADRRENRLAAQSGLALPPQPHGVLATQPTGAHLRH